MKFEISHLIINTEKQLYRKYDLIAVESVEEPVCMTTDDEMVVGWVELALALQTTRHHATLLGHPLNSISHYVNNLN